MDHDVEHGQLLEVEQAAEHVAVGALDVALLVQQVDGALQLLGARQHRALMLRRAAAEQREETAHEQLDGEQNRPKDRDERRQHAHEQQRDAVGVVDRDRLGQNLREDEQQHGHDRRRPDRPPARRRSASSTLVMKAEEPMLTSVLPSSVVPISRSRRRSSLLTIAARCVAVAFERVHARARRARHRRLRRGEERAHRDAEDDDRGRDPDVDGQGGRRGAVHVVQAFGCRFVLEEPCAPRRRRCPLR